MFKFLNLGNTLIVIIVIYDSMIDWSIDFNGMSTCLGLF